jgi:hypothetical protein
VAQWFAWRARVFLALGATGGILAGSHHGAVGHNLNALAATLGEQAQGAGVASSDLRWQPSAGILSDILWGRKILYLARAAGGDVRDVWQARVRLSPEGGVVGVTGAHNLTSTPLGDDHELVVLGTHAAFVTAAYGHEQSISVLDLAGEGPQNRSDRLLDRAMAAVTNLQQTGDLRGVGRFDITLESPAMAAALRLDETLLDIALFDTPSSVPTRTGQFDIERGQLSTTLSGAHASASPRLPKLLSHWLVDTLRADPRIGPAPIARIEDAVLSLRDAYRQFAFRRGTLGTDVVATPAVDPPAGPVPQPTDAGAWPPAHIPTIWRSAEDGEGTWHEPNVTWIRRPPGLTSDAPAPFYETFLRPDEKRPYVRVSLVVMNMHQLDLDMEAGVEDPEPLTGPHGSGRIPRDPAIFRRVAAAFNGAFKTDHGHYGMMVHKRVLLPAVPEAATVAVLDDGRVAFGTWGPEVRRSGYGIDVDRAIVSFRQNLDALVDHGVINPTGRNLWGFTLPGTSAQTERSGLCVTTTGHLLYAWGDDLSASTLASAMRMGECDYAIHLDMNPYHTGFVFTAIDDFATKSYRAELLSPAMSIPIDRYIHFSPKDFFYVTIHDPTPPAIDGAAPWEDDGGLQPPPSWMPGIWSSHVDVPGGRIEIFDVEPGRAVYRIRAGTGDATAAFPLRELEEQDAARALLAVGAGVAPDKRPRGLATGGKLAVPIAVDSDWGQLIVSPDRGLSIATAREHGQLNTDEDMLELPVIVWDGQPTATSLPGPVQWRAALGVTSSGRVLFARGRVGSYAVLADILVKAQCDRALALERGSRVEGRWDRRERSGVLMRPRSEESVVYVLGSSLVPRGVRLDAVHFPPK